MGRWHGLWIFVHITICCHLGKGNRITDNGENLDIRRAVNTSQTLWLLHQTYLNGFYASYKGKNFFEEETCIRINKINISETDYNFTQTMEIILEEYKEPTLYRGIFTKDKKSMRVINSEDPVEPQLWTLHYQDPENGPCMVFIIQELRPQLGNEMRVCHMYFRGRPNRPYPPASCQAFFDRRCDSSKIYTPYRNNCTDDNMSVETAEINNNVLSNYI